MRLVAALRAELGRHVDTRDVFAGAYPGRAGRAGSAAAAPPPATS